MRDGKIIKATGYGLANVELNVPVTPQMVFHPESLAKAFTATAVMRSALSLILAVQRGRYTVGSRTHSGERRHDDSIWKLQGPELQRTEERFFGHCDPFTLLSCRGRLEKRDRTHIDCDE
jgi:Beta-lactamase